MIKSAGLLIIRKNKVLLVKPKNIDSDNNWSIPKGIIDAKDNNIVSTAIRETLEETGLLIPQNKIDISKRSIISYINSKGLPTKIIFYFVVEISDEEFSKFRKSDILDSSEIEMFDFFTFREARKKMYWKQHSALNFLRPHSFCINELELLIQLGYIYKTKHPTFPLWLYNITKKCKLHRYWNYTTLSCRGLILDEAGCIIARPFKKFFEKKEIYHEILDILPGDGQISEKLDGALGVLYNYKNNRYICCKNNFTHYSGTIGTDAYSNTFSLSNLIPEKMHTLLFEIISNKIPFTVNYHSEHSIIPIAVIDNTTGNSIFSLMSHLGDIIPKPFDNLKEGWVTSYSDGTLIKHKNKEFMVEYQKLKIMKERKFNEDFDKFSSIADRKKIIDHHSVNRLINLELFFYSDSKSYEEKLIYWV